MSERETVSVYVDGERVMPGGGGGLKKWDFRPPSSTLVDVVVNIAIPPYLLAYHSLN